LIRFAIVNLSLDW